MLFGLGLGLTVAVLVYLDGQQTAGPPVAVTVTAPPAAEIPVPTTPAPAAAETGDSEGLQFEFYNMLPRFEVVLPESELEARPDIPDTTEPVLEDPGRYVLQAGSFRTEADAEGRRASLALLGIESSIQRVTIDTDEYHRVRIGPTSDLDSLNGIRTRLWDAEIEVLLIKLSD
ncbi:MAG: SPOR domain-containing protein [Rhodospirillaceae bacterium]|nr:SPOR domain-containing protein [Rhodospirillaceae bacterium]